MFGTLPDFTPRDSHSLWYISTRNPGPPPGLFESLNAEANINGQHGAHTRQQQRDHHKLLERTALARLGADEVYMHRRRLNIQNFGSGWLKPPGIPKTLHQLREEKREQEEHQEALRREQLQQELAEAEAGGMPGDEDGTMDDVQLDGAQDLDDMIPEAEDEFEVDDDDDEEEEDEEEEEQEEEDEDANDADETGNIDEEHLREERQNELMAARVRSNNDAFREAIVRGDPDGDDMYGGAEELVEEVQGHMLDEDDFADNSLLQPGANGSLLDDEDMGVDLDDEIPEAESGGYEHTDSEAGLSSDEEEEEEEGDEDGEEDEEIGFAPRSALLAPPRSPTLRGRTSASGPRASMDLSGLLSQDESSFMDSSPAAPGRWAQGRQ
ncbi:hypothetical protein NLU13_4232 [Sarocladium strictum]|uniref:Anaphase-promoting complex, subunit 15/MND2 n=1 Tax=Sarocladium strictum TaxID=5046 RepID=A0AA39GJV5_SARSR|nr:hypothetical protein NLU13_4232 [Sarocladium strictum]